MPVPTLLPIYMFGKRLGLHPLHLMGVDANIGTAANRVCINSIRQYSWQDADGVSRDELAQAIYDAEQEIADYLGYWPAPKWVADERVELVDVDPGYWARSGWDIRGDRISVKAGYGQLISGGRVAKTLVEAAAAVVYTDVDGDGYKETATVVVATSVTDPEEIALYYPSVAGDDEWEVRPIDVSITGGVATIVCRREQLVKQVLLEALDAGNISGTTDSNFLDTVDVYRKYNDPCVQVEFQWRSSDLGCWLCNDSGCTACGLTIQPGCMTVKDKALGIVTLSAGNCEDGSYSNTTFDVCRRPDNVRLWYRSGWRDMSLATPNLTMSREWQIAVAKLAISKLDRQICSCKAVSDVQSHWNSDLRKSRSTRESSNTYKVTEYELENNPFGTTVAALDVWRLARRRSIQV